VAKYGVEQGKFTVKRPRKEPITRWKISFLNVSVSLSKKMENFCSQSCCRVVWDTEMAVGMSPPLIIFIAEKHGIPII
jgi:hypothetical protein